MRNRKQHYMRTTALHTSLRVTAVVPWMSEATRKRAAAVLRDRVTLAPSKKETN
jgi:hypothetical protein